MFNASSYYSGAINTSQSTYEGYIQNGLFSIEGQLLAHEFGHYLQEVIFNKINYNWHIAPTSFYNYLLLSDPVYNKTLTEVLANTMSYYYFNCPSNWDTYFNEIDLDIISGPLKGKLMQMGFQP